MRILNIVTGGLRREGITSTQLSFMKEIDKNGLSIDMAVVAPSDEDMINHFRAVGCRIVELPFRKNEFIRYFRSLIQTIRAYGYDIIHVHGSSGIIGIELLAARIAGCNIRIAHSRNTRCDHKILDKVLRLLLYSSATDLFACGQDAGKWLFGKRQFKVIHNGKDLDLFRFSKRTRAIQRDKLRLRGKLTIGHVGNFNTQKNQIFLLYVFYKFLKINSDSILYFMGDGELRKECEQFTVRLGLTKNVVYAGTVNDVHDRLQAMDVMVLPSLFEGLPNVVLEWQASGLTCLVSDRVTDECKVSDLVKFLPLECLNIWVSSLQSLNAICAERTERSDDACEKLKKSDFSIRNNAEELKQLYFNLVKRECT